MKLQTLRIERSMYGTNTGHYAGEVYFTDDEGNALCIKLPISTGDLIVDKIKGLLLDAGGVVNTRCTVEMPPLLGRTMPEES